VIDGPWEVNRVIAHISAWGSVGRDGAVGKIKRNAPGPIPMALIGRLAVSDEMIYRGQGLGPAL